MVVEVHMRIKLLTVAILVRSTADVFGVVEQVGNACPAPDEVQEFIRADQVVKPLVGPAQLGEIRMDRLAALGSQLADRLVAAKARKGVGEITAEFRGQQVVDDKMVKRLGVFERAGESVVVGARLE